MIGVGFHFKLLSLLLRSSKAIDMHHMLGSNSEIVCTRTKVIIILDLRDWCEIYHFGYSSLSHTRQPIWYHWWIEKRSNGACKASGLGFLGKPISVFSLFIVKFDSFLKLVPLIPQVLVFMLKQWFYYMGSFPFLVWFFFVMLSLKSSSVFGFWENGGRRKEILIQQFFF